MHADIGVWLAAGRLNQGKFVWPKSAGTTLSLPRPTTRRAPARLAAATHR